MVSMIVLNRKANRTVDFHQSNNYRDDGCRVQPLQNQQRVYPLKKWMAGK